jgi:DNA-binding MarR family transcriptional regulator
VQDGSALPLDAETKVAERPADHEVELRLWLRLFTCTTLIEGEIRRRLRENFDLTLPRFDLMAQLDKAPEGMSLGELSKRMMVSNGNLTGLTERLMAQGLVSRRASPSDRRAQIVCLTSEGRRAFGVVARAHGNWIAELFAELTPSEVESLMGLLAMTKGSVRRRLPQAAAGVGGGQQKSRQRPARLRSHPGR